MRDCNEQNHQQMSLFAHMWFSVTVVILKIFERCTATTKMPFQLHLFFLFQSSVPSKHCKGSTPQISYLTFMFIHIHTQNHQKSSCSNHLPWCLTVNQRNRPQRLSTPGSFTNKNTANAAWTSLLCRGGFAFTSILLWGAGVPFEMNPDLFRE